MKKIRRIALLSIIFILTITFSVFAAEEEQLTATLTLMPSATEVEAGDTVEITISAQCETGVGAVSGVLEYDGTKLELLTVTEDIGIDGYLSGCEVTESGKIELTLAYNREGEAPKESNFAKLQFKVLDEVIVNDVLNIKVSGIEILGTDEDAITLEDKETTIKIAGEEAGNIEPEPEDEPKLDLGIADKPINNTGLSNNAFIIVFGAIVSVALYAKCKKYRDVK